MIGLSVGVFKWFALVILLTHKLTKFSVGLWQEEAS
jgi:hypothetical protein